METIRQKVISVFSNKILPLVGRHLNDDAYLKIMYRIVMGRKLHLTPPFCLQRNCSGLKLITMIRCGQSLLTSTR